MYALVYFNPTEAWKLWIMANYPRRAGLNGDGRHVPDWYESLMVCPESREPLGRHHLDRHV